MLINYFVKQFHFATKKVEKFWNYLGRRAETGVVK